MKKPLTPEQKKQKAAWSKVYYRKKHPLGSLKPYRHGQNFAANPREYRLRWHFEKIYGITLEKYDEILRAQDGLCAICGSPPAERNHGKGISNRLVVDHDHATGEVRGLLCFRCNYGIGMLEDSPRLLDKMGHYLRKHAQLKLVRGGA